MKCKTLISECNDTIKGEIEMSRYEWQVLLGMGISFSEADELSNAIGTYKILQNTIDKLRYENENLKKESSEKSEWLKAKNEALDNLIIAYNKLEKEHKELSATLNVTGQLVAYKKAHEKLNKELIKAYAENEKLKKESYEKSEWLKAKNEALGNLMIAYDKLEKECKELKANDAFLKIQKALSETESKYRNALRVQKELAEKLQNATNDKNITNLNNEISALRKTARNNENAFKSMKRNYDELVKQLRGADLDGDVITLPHNGEKIKINQQIVKKTTVSIKEEIDKLAAAGELAGLICTFFGIDDEED